MSNWFAIALAVILFADADVPRVEQFRQPSAKSDPFPSGEEVPLFPGAVAAAQSDSASQKVSNRPRADKLQEESKLELIRYVSGEFARAVKALPAGKEGFQLYAGKALDGQQLDRAVATHGAAVHTGDQVQITGLQFRDHTIVVDVNGGGRGKKHWYDHIQFGMGGGGMPLPQSRVTQENQGPPGLQPGMGSTIFLEFNKSVPDLTPEELKQALSSVLDFSKQRSAAVQWYDTLPPEMKKAIQERKPVVGMDREMVVAAIGKPGHKVRERDAEGNEIEDWIYGTPPDKTIFVRFTGDRVTAIEQFPR
jgi:hypothetical protein